MWVGREAVVMERIAGCLHRKVSGRFKLTNFGGAPLPHLGQIFFILMQLSGNFCQKKIGGCPLGVSPILGNPGSAGESHLVIIESDGMSSLVQE